MRRRWVEPLILILMGAAALWDGAYAMTAYSRVAGARLGGGYLVLIGFILVALGVAYWFKSGSEGSRGAVESRPSPGLRWVLIAFALLVGYVLAIPYLGYLLSTALFLVTCLRIFGSYRWAPVVTASFTLAIASAYAWAALGMMLPSGVLPWP